MSRIRTFACLLMVASGALAVAAAPVRTQTAAPATQSGRAASPQTTAALATTSTTSEAMMLEGEKRYRTNCGRCHQSPHKFGARVMATAVRHMRVRAMLTDDDMKYITYYMTH